MLYEVITLVYYNENLYLSLLDGNINHLPTTSPAYWRAVATGCKGFLHQSGRITSYNVCYTKLLRQVTSEEQAGVYKKAVEKSVKRKGLTVPETGEVIKKGFWKEMKAARNKATELVNQLEDDFIPSKGIVEDLREVLKMESGSEIPSKGIPAELEKGIKDISSGSVTTVKELYKHRKTWRRAYDQMTSPRA